MKNYIGIRNKGFCFFSPFWCRTHTWNIMRGVSHVQRMWWMWAALLRIILNAYVLSLYYQSWLIHWSICRYQARFPLGFLERSLDCFHLVQTGQSSIHAAAFWKANNTCDPCKEQQHCMSNICRIGASQRFLCLETSQGRLHVRSDIDCVSSGSTQSANCNS